MSKDSKSERVIAEPLQRLKWLMLIVVLAGEVMDMLDNTVLDVALPSMRRTLGASTASFQWIAATYGITLAITLIPAARLGDIYGRRKLFIIGLAGFILASIATGTAPNVGIVIAARLVAGMCAGLMMPQTLAIIKTSFPSKQVALAMGATGPLVGLTAAFGPALGGFIIGANFFGLSWRPVFFLNVPIGCLAILGTFLLVRESTSPKPGHMDWPSIALLTPAWLFILYPLIQGRALHWPAWCFAALVFGVSLIAIFAYRQYQLVRAGRVPMVNLNLFRQRSMSASLGLMLLYLTTMSGLVFALSLYLQLGRGYSPAHAGSLMIPWAIGIIVGLVGIGGFAPRIGRVVIQIGLGLQAIGAIVLHSTCQHADTHASHLLLPLAISGIGMGAIIGPLFSFALKGVKDEQVSSAAGLLNSVDQLAGAVGVAVIGTIFFTKLAADSNMGLLGSFNSALGLCEWITAGVCAISVIAVQLLPSRPRDEDEIEALSVPQSTAL